MNLLIFSLLAIIPVLTVGGAIVMARYLNVGQPGRTLATFRTFWEMPTGLSAIIGAVLAAAVAISGYVFNDHLARIKDDEARARHRAEVAAAFQAEISAFRVQAQGICATFAKVVAQTHYAGRPKAPIQLPEPRVWQALAPEIGLLDGEAGPAVSWFYGLSSSVLEALNADDLTFERKYNHVTLLVEGADQALTLLRPISGRNYEARAMLYGDREPCSVRANDLRPRQN